MIGTLLQVKHEAHNMNEFVFTMKDTIMLVGGIVSLLGSYFALKYNQKAADEKIVILKEDILRQKQLHPAAKVVVHPECNPEVIALADEVASTGGICKFAKTTAAQEIIVGTEIGLLYRLKKENPQKTFYAASDLAVCPNMKLTTLEKVLSSLEKMRYEITVSEKIISRARQGIQRMLDYGNLPSKR